jgi:DnaJ like chaperone protein
MAMNWNGKIAGRWLGRLAVASMGAALGALRKPRPHEPAALAEPPSDPRTLEAIGKRFFRVSFEVMGHLAKADGRISEAEIAAASAFMDELGLDEAGRREAIACFTRGKQPHYDYRAELSQLADLCRGRPDLARLFLEVQVQISLASNDLPAPVHRLLRRLAAALGFSSLELLQIEAVLRIPQLGGLAGGRSGSGATVAVRALEEAYRILETSAAASDEEVVNAYRRQLQRHHPDKLKAHGLPESMLAHAQQRTQQIIEAWEIVRERRGIR